MPGVIPPHGEPMTERESAAYREAGHAVIAYFRNVDFQRVNILPYDLVGWNYESSVSDGFERTDAYSYGDIGQREIRLAGLFAQCLHLGGFTPGREAAETYIRAANACLKCSEDDAVQYDLACEVKHGNVSVNQSPVDEALSSPYARDILFDVSDHWHLVEVVAIALMERGSLSQAEVHQIIQAKEC
jgi:hypothetical protein